MIAPVPVHCFSLTFNVQLLDMDGAVRTNGPLFIGDADNHTLVCVEAHLPYLFLFLEHIQVFLKLVTIGNFRILYNRLSSLKSLLSDLTHSGMPFK